MLFLDIETYSPVKLMDEGVYNYAASPDFRILIITYAVDDSPVTVIDLTREDCDGNIPDYFREMLTDPDMLKVAHNAAFERVCFRAVGIDVPVEQWRCTAVKAAYCGLPRSLDGASTALGVPADKAKLSTGKADIRYFCCPDRKGSRRSPQNHPERWQRFVDYAVGDTITCRWIHSRLSRYEVTPTTWRAYAVDQHINDRGFCIDRELVDGAISLVDAEKHTALLRIQNLTGLANPNSLPQLKAWLTDQLSAPISSITKETLPDLILRAETEGAVAAAEVLRLREKVSFASVGKFKSMARRAGRDGRVRGSLLFYGARTGRWAGRGVQPHNLPRNYLPRIEIARSYVKRAERDGLRLLWGDMAHVFPQLIRTAIVAPEGYALAPVDFSAIEARVLAYLAGEDWKLEVFRTTGKIYEATAGRIYGIDPDTIRKDSPQRAHGKVAELALGYQGWVGALMQMGADSLGLSENELAHIASAWREASPRTVALWRKASGACVAAILSRQPMSITPALTADYDGDALTIELPSGRKLTYWNPKVIQNDRGKRAISYLGNPSKKEKKSITTYGGKLVENITQAVAADLLTHALIGVHDAGYQIDIHVHDEVVPVVPQATAHEHLRRIIQIMTQRPAWAKNLPLAADGFVTTYYRK